MKASGWPEIKTWVLGFGADAELLEPKEKRKELRQELAAAGERYSG